MKDLIQKAGLRGKFQVECYDKHGNLKWAEDFPNGIVDEGVAYLLDAGFDGAAQSTAWYIGLIDNDSFSTLDDGDTMSSHSGWVENTDYDEADRVTWPNDATSSRSMSNSTTADFTMNATATIKGIFIVDDDTKGGTSGTLWSTASFSSNASVTSGDELKITYTING